MRMDGESVYKSDEKRRKNRGRVLLLTKNCLKERGSDVKLSGISAVITAKIGEIVLKIRL